MPILPAAPCSAGQIAVPGDETCRELASCGDGTWGDIPVESNIPVNLHPRDVMDDSLLEPETPLAQMASRAVLEVTERQLLGDTTAVAARVWELEALGYRIGSDDLGAYYASLNAFATLRPDFVKLDIGLLRDVDTSELQARLIPSLVRVCGEMGMTAVAEGVETVAERTPGRAGMWLAARVPLRQARSRFAGAGAVRASTASPAPWRLSTLVSTGPCTARLGWATWRHRMPSVRG